MLLAISMLAMNVDGFLTKFQSILAAKFPWLLSSSILSLLAERKAISDPEAKAENKRQIKTMDHSDICCENTCFIRYRLNGSLQRLTDF